MTTEPPYEQSTASAPAPEPLLADMAPLIERLRTQVGTWSPSIEPCANESREAFARRTGFVARRQGRADVVLASQTAVELGHPRTDSCAFVLATWQSGLVHDGRLSRIGSDFSALRPDVLHPIAQIVLLQLRSGPPPDPFGLDTAQYLINRLPGYMVRTVPGRLWVRVATSALRRGLSFSDVARALMFTYREEFPEVVGVEVVVASEGADRIQSLSPLATEAAILAGKHKKLVLQPDGDVECADLSCEACDEKPTCDALRDVVIKRRRRT